METETLYVVRYRIQFNMGTREMPPWAKVIVAQM